MSYLIKNGDLTERGTASETFISLETFLRQGGTAVRLEADEQIEAIAGRLSGVTAVALDFPAFADGRAYSSANILRRTYDFKGEIRAIGDVRIDQLEQMVRCGFNAFELDEDQNRELALTRLTGFPYSYQATIDRQPIFSERA